MATTRAQSISFDTTSGDWDAWFRRGATAVADDDDGGDLVPLQPGDVIYAVAEAATVHAAAAHSTAEACDELEYHGQRSGAVASSSRQVRVAAANATWRSTGEFTAPDDDDEYLFGASLSTKSQQRGATALVLVGSLVSINLTPHIVEIPPRTDEGSTNMARKRRAEVTIDDDDES